MIHQYCLGEKSFFIHDKNKQIQPLFRLSTIAYYCKKKIIHSYKLILFKTING